jgi:peptidoglycan/LPS O-acetylase OafA/YrhL
MHTSRPDDSNLDRRDDRRRSRLADPAATGEQAAARTNAKTVFGVQVLRGLAAAMVIMYHAASNLRDSAGYYLIPGLSFGSGGVDLFFLISGFVMVRTTEGQLGQPGAWSRFLGHRLIRIVPLYWFLTTLKIGAVLSLPALFRNADLLPWNITASYLFVPAWDARGAASPVIAAGWTLCYEMFFYYTFTLCLAARWSPVMVITPIFIAAAGIGMARDYSWGAVATLLDPLLLEFVAGMWIGRLVRFAASPATAPWLIALAGAAGLALVLSDLLPDLHLRGDRVLFWGVPAAVILAAVVSLERVVIFRRWGLLCLIGDASYSIYLAHALVLPLVLRPLRPLSGTLGGEVVGLVSLFAAGLFAGLAVFVVIERPMRAMVKRVVYSHTVRGGVARQTRAQNVRQQSVSRPASIERLLAMERNKDA